MDFFKAVRSRASVRSFEKCEVPEEDLRSIVDAGRRAPSGLNRQPWEFIIIRDEATLQQLGRIQGCIAGAAAAIAVVADDSTTDWWREDCAAAIENMLLAARALDYHSLWVQGYVMRNEQFGKKLLNVPDELRLVAVLPVGKAAGKASQASKKPLDELVHYDSYGS